MRKLFEAADRYLETSDWKIIAVLKFCLISLGVILGMEVKEKSRKPVFIAAVSVFIATYIPLMTRFERPAFTDSRCKCRKAVSLPEIESPRILA